MNVIAIYLVKSQLSNQKQQFMYIVCCSTCYVCQCSLTHVQLIICFQSVNAASHKLHLYKC